jgi:hypothetical protein
MEVWCVLVPHIVTQAGLLKRSSECEDQGQEYFPNHLYLI